MATLYSKKFPILSVAYRFVAAAFASLCQAYKALWCLARSQLRFVWLALISLVIISLIVLPNYGVLREDLQAIAFPILFLGFWRLPKERIYQVPAPLMLLALTLWAGATLHVKGITSGKSDVAQVIFARLTTDQQGLEARGRYKRYGEIARTYELLGGALVHRGATSNGNAANWLASSHPLSPFLVRGEPAWMEVVFNPKLRFRNGEQTATRLVQVDWSDRRFAIGYLPSVLNVPGEPRELGLHYLAWLAQSVRPSFEEPGTEAIHDAARTVALRRDALAQITDLDGAWLSNSPFGLGYYLLGTWDLLEAVEQGLSSDELFKSSLGKFRSAASHVRIYDDPELYSLIFNNAAVAQLASAKVVADFSQARHWFRIALDVVETTDQLPLGARLAYDNLLKLEASVRIVE